MSLDAISGLIHMGGQGAYVWGAVAAVFLALVAELAALTVRDRDSAERAQPVSKENHR